MSILVEQDVSTETIADLLSRLGDISPARVRLHPSPGTATEADVVGIHAREKRLFELVDGILVEKGMGYRESVIAQAIARALGNWVQPRNLGVVSGESGMMKLYSAQVRIPDVAFVSRDRLPDGKVPREAVPRLVPDIAVEVLSESNTIREMERKRGEYFKAGTRLVWIVDAEARTVAVYTSPEACVVLREGDVLDGGSVLPGFGVSLRELFSELD